MTRAGFWRLIGGLGLGLILIIPMMVGGARAAEGEKVTWTFATNPGPAANTWSFHPYPRFQKLLERNSGGRFIIETKVGLYPPKEVIHAAGLLP
ncbi:MAG: hypothetical protein MI702_01750, partial [Chlorobiales bacterium]|nr:hypothetical protein [Chlorobiales bacterium]